MIYKYILDKDSYVKFKGAYYTQTPSAINLEGAKVYIFDDERTVYLNGGSELDPIRQIDLDETIKSNPYYQAYDFWKYIGNKPNSTLSVDLRAISYSNNVKVDYSTDLLYFQSGWAQDFTVTIPEISTDPFTGMYFDTEDNYIFFRRNALDNNKLYLCIRHVDLNEGNEVLIKLSDDDLAGKKVRFLVNYAISKDIYLAASDNQEIKVAWKCEDGTYGIMDSFNTPYPTPNVGVFSFANSIKIYSNDFLDVPFGTQVFSDFIVNALTLDVYDNTSVSLSKTWENISDPLTNFESFIVTGLEGGIYNLQKDKHYHFTVPMDLNGQSKGSTLDINEIARYAYISIVDGPEQVSDPINWKVVDTDYECEDGDHLLLDTRNNSFSIKLPNKGSVYLSDGYYNFGTNNVFIIPNNPAHTIQGTNGIIGNVDGDFFYLVLDNEDWRYVGMNSATSLSSGTSSNTRGSVFPSGVTVFHQHELLNNPIIENGLYLFTGDSWSLLQSVN